MFLIDVYGRFCLLCLVVAPLVFFIVALVVAAIVGHGHIVVILIIEDIINMLGWHGFEFISELDVWLV